MIKKNNEKNRFSFEAEEISKGLKKPEKLNEFVA